MKDYNLAEAKFLRGYAYFWLTKVYDDVPLLLSPQEQANPTPTRTPFEQVQQAAIKDLTEAESALLKRQARALFRKHTSWEADLLAQLRKAIGKSELAKAMGQS